MNNQLLKQKMAAVKDYNEIDPGDGIGAGDIEVFPPTRAVKLIHQGPYGSQGPSYFKLFSYCRGQGYRVKLPLIEHFIKGPGMVFQGNPQKYKTECIVLVEEDGNDGYIRTIGSVRSILRGLSELWEKLLRMCFRSVTKYQKEIPDGM